MGSQKSRPASVEDRNIKLVDELGQFLDGAVIDRSKTTRGLAQKHCFFGSEANIVRCAEGHVMRGKVSREGYGRIQAFCHRSVCDSCGDDVDVYSMKYYCSECKVTLCSNCCRSQLCMPLVDGPPEPPVALEAGDIIMTLGGPTITTHHIMLVLSELHEDVEMAQVLQVPPGTEIWSCKTVESTGLETGTHTWWHPATTFFSRDRHARTVELVADITEDVDEICVAKTPVPVKVLMHPARPEYGGPGIDENLFVHVAIEEMCNSEAWSAVTATRAFLKNFKKKHFEAEEYQTEEEKDALMEMLRESWKKPPICVSVPIIVWQMYFDKLNSEDPGAAADGILEYMPLLADQTSPSTMARGLTEKGWILRDSFEP